MEKPPFSNNDICIGQHYRHFKGNLYEVVGIATNTETKEKMVVYKALYGSKSLYVRPYKMFIEELNRTQYPSATQKHRFELVTM